jgi:hypothetical protein
LPDATRAELRDAADYLKGTGLGWVQSVDGVLVAEISAAVEIFVKKARARGDCQNNATLRAGERARAYNKRGRRAVARTTTA